MKAVATQLIPVYFVHISFIFFYKNKLLECMRMYCKAIQNTPYLHSLF